MEDGSSSPKSERSVNSSHKRVLFACPDCHGNFGSRQALALHRHGNQKATKRAYTKRSSRATLATCDYQPVTVSRTPPMLNVQPRVPVSGSGHAGLLTARPWSGASAGPGVLMGPAGGGQRSMTSVPVVGPVIKLTPKPTNGVLQDQTSSTDTLGNKTHQYFTIPVHQEPPPFAPFDFIKDWALLPSSSFGPALYDRNGVIAGAGLKGGTVDLELRLGR